MIDLNANISFLSHTFIFPPSGPWNSQVMDETLVRAQARLASTVQKSENQEQPLGGHHPAYLLSDNWTA